MNIHKPLVYVVDDNASICRALTLLLKAHGFKVETFKCAKDFLSFRHPKCPACLVLDVRLPDIDGLHLQNTMIRQQLLVPTIFITGHGDIPMSVKAMQSGAIDFLPKPFTEKKLLNAITRAIEKSKTQNKEQAEIARIKRHIKTLSPRELEVFQLVAKGMMSKNIAFKRGTSLQM